MIFAIVAVTFVLTRNHKLRHCFISGCSVYLHEQEQQPEITRTSIELDISKIFIEDDVKRDI